MQSCTPTDTGSAGVALKLPSPIVGYVDTNIWFANGSAEASEFVGPLSSVVDSTRWFIIPDTNNLAAMDTLVFYYKREPIFLSTSCGYTIKYSLYDIFTTKHIIDSARIEKTEVNNANDVIHVKVFY